MNEQKNIINIEKLRSTYNSLNLINNSLDNNIIDKDLIELEQYFRKLNFEHGNCISNYKNYMTSILEKIDEMKKNINNLRISIDKTINQVSNLEDCSERNNINFRKNMSPELIKTATTEISQIPKPVTVEQQPLNNESTQTEINTIPIALGIGASGISGAVGAVIVDSMMYNDKQDDIEDYKEPEELINQEKVEKNEKERVFENENTPYQASHDNEKISKFYGTNITEYYESEDDNSRTND